ncbi:MAG: hypothetical protein IKR17_00250 [Bacteroidales bacterium]|nr:hypothetical protein [Bacteroidales bacterium]
MKKLFAIAAVAAMFVACSGNSNSACCKDAACADSTVVADSTVADSAAVADSTVADSAAVENAAE